MDPDTDFERGDLAALLFGGLVLFITVIVTVYSLDVHYHVH